MQKKCFDLTSGEFKKLNLTNPVFTTGATFKDALRQLGVFPGIRLVVHSSLGSLGKFEGGAENLCRILCELVTEDGTLMLPGLVKYPEDGENFVYEPEMTPTNMGIIPETFRKLPGVVRSLDPTHSFSVWGKDKIDFVRDHHKLPSMHERSPLGLLENVGGYCLLIGCRSVTFMHIVETDCDAGCLGTRTEEYKGLINGRSVKLRGWGWRAEDCPAFHPKELFARLQKLDSFSECMLGRCHLMLFKLSDYRKAYIHFLLNPENGCRSCKILPRKVKQNVPSDWDCQKGVLKTSDAFTDDFF